MPQINTFLEFVNFSRSLLPIYEEITTKTKILRSGEMVTIAPTQGMRRETADLVNYAGEHGPSTVTNMFVSAQIMAGGPKVFRPSRAQCECLCRTLPKVEIKDYHQPFPTFAVELPRDFRSQFQPEPIFVGIHHDPNAIFLDISCADATALTYILVEKTGVTIEELIQKATNALWEESSLPTSAAEMSMSVVLARLAVNACLLLVDGGFKERKDNPQHEARLERLLEKARRGKGRSSIEDLEREKSLIPTVVDFAQNISLGRRSSGKSSQQDSLGEERHTKPHWRAGHIRRQRFGEGLREVKQVFIAPVLVNSHLITGDISWTTSYRAMEE